MESNPYPTIHGYEKDQVATIRPLLPGPPPTQPHPPSSYSANTFYLDESDIKHFREKCRNSIFGHASIAEMAQRNSANELQFLRELFAHAEYENHLRCNIMSSLEMDKIRLQSQLSEMWGELEDTKHAEHFMREKFEDVLDRLRRMKLKGQEESERCVSCEGTGWSEMPPWKAYLREADIEFKGTLQGLLFQVDRIRTTLQNTRGRLPTKDEMFSIIGASDPTEMTIILQDVNTYFLAIERKIGRIETWCMGQKEIMDKLKSKAKAQEKNGKGESRRMCYSGSKRE